LYPIAGISIIAEEIHTQTNEGAAVLYIDIVAALKNAGLIDSYAFSLYLDDWGSKTGSIVFGGVDTAKYHGDLITVPVASSPSTNLQTAWAVMLDGVSLADASGTIKVSTSNLSSYGTSPSSLSLHAPLTFSQRSSTPAHHSLPSHPPSPLRSTPTSAPFSPTLPAAPDAASSCHAVSAPPTRLCCLPSAATARTLLSASRFCSSSYFR
jgi:hypothetical protein